MDDEQGYFVTSEDMKQAENISWIWGYVCGMGSAVIIAGFVYMWYTNQVAINQWLMPH